LRARRTGYPPGGAEHEAKPHSLPMPTKISPPTSHLSHPKREVTVMSGQLSKWFKVCTRQFAARDRNNQCDESKALEHARREWLAASRLFDYATDPELVDYSIYSLQAAEKHFVYLWKRARERKGGE